MKIIHTKKNILVLLIVIVFVSTLPILQSCNSSDESMQVKTSKKNSLEYLDMDVTNLQKPTVDQKLVFEKAKERIDPYVVYENKSFSLTISKGSEINISERLFNLLKTTINNTNKALSGLNIEQDSKNPKLLHIILALDLNKNKRFKAFGYDAVPNDGENSWNADWAGINIFLNNSTAQKLDLALAAGATGSEIVAILGANPGAAVLGAILGYGAAEIGIMNQGKGIEISVGILGGLQSR